VTRLPKVGGLVDPDTERILALRPDLVVVYDAQQELRQRLAQVGVPIFSYAHKDLAHVLATIRAIGERVGARDGAERIAGGIERKLGDIAARVKGRPRPSVLLVFGREPQSLRNIYANGGYGFLHDMVDIAGGRDVFEDVKRENVQASMEMILARQPEIIIEWLAPPGDHADLSVWRTLSSLPAVKTNRIHQVVGDRFVEAGPYVADATEQLARFIHPEVWGR
jgi:iron complex transport system substrate-binding protein